VRFRRGPGTSFAIIRVLPPGTSLVSLGSASDAADRTWYRVRFGARYGWVAGWLTRAGPARVQAQPTAGPSSGWHLVRASSYGIGDGYLGRTMACGGRLTTSILAVAHRTLACGTRVRIRYHGRVVAARVLDRGPYVAGRVLDLAPAVCTYLGNCGLPLVEWQLAP
jgi:hypothetical protein